MNPSAAPGWYGKLPTLGDFASRRLEPGFIEPWDAWLAAGLAAQREALGAGWVRAYLHSPAWRFVLMPGVLSGVSSGELSKAAGGPRSKTAWAGVLMPSVDQVGRYFPLTLASPLTALPAGAAGFEALLGWLQRLEDVAVDAMQDDWSIDRLEDVLATMAPACASVAPAAPNAFAAALEGDGGFVDLQGIRSRAELAAMVVEAVGAAAGDAWQPAAAGRSFWLADHPDRPRLLASRGLPSRAEFIGMLDASSRDADATTLF